MLSVIVGPSCTAKMVRGKLRSETDLKGSQSREGRVQGMINKCERSNVGGGGGERLVFGAKRK